MTPEPSTYADTPFALLHYTYACARGMVQAALSLARHVAREKPGSMAWVWRDSLRAQSHRHVDRVAATLADHQIELALVVLHFARRDHQLHAHLHVEVATGGAVELTGAAQPDTIGPWTAQTAERITRERAA